MRPGCQDVSHDAVPQEGDLIDNVPYPRVVGQDVVDGVGGGFQAEFHPSPEFGSAAVPPVKAGPCAVAFVVLEPHRTAHSSVLARVGAAGVGCFAEGDYAGEEEQCRQYSAVVPRHCASVCVLF